MSDGVYSLDEVQKHKSPKDLWIVIYNHVYEMQDYLEDHPGGKEFLLENAGTDATTAYEDIGKLSALVSFCRARLNTRVIVVMQATPQTHERYWRIFGLANSLTMTGPIMKQRSCHK